MKYFTLPTAIAAGTVAGIAVALIADSAVGQPKFSERDYNIGHELNVECAATSQLGLAIMDDMRDGYMPVQLEAIARRKLNRIGAHPTSELGTIVLGMLDGISRQYNMVMELPATQDMGRHFFEGFYTECLEFKRSLK